MNFGTALVLLAIALVGISMRLSPGRIWGVPSSDSGYHLLLRDVLKKTKLSMPESISRLPLDDVQVYPWLYHQMIALIPDATLNRWPGLPSAIIDTIYFALVVMVGVFFLGSSVNESWSAAMLAGAIFLFSSGVMAAGIGPRTYEITPRPLGELLVAAALVSLGVAYAYSNDWAVLAAAFSLALAALSSKFAVQVAVIACVGLSVVLMWPQPVLALAGGAVLAIVLSGGRYIAIAYGQYCHLIIYYQRITSTHPALRYRNDWARMHKLLKTIIAAPTHENLQQFARVLLANTIIQGLYRNSVLLTAIAGVLLFETENIHKSFESFLVAWVAVMFFAFVATSFKLLAHFGEAERYLEYAALPASILASLIIFENHLFGTFLLALCICVAVAHIIHSFAQFHILHQRDANDMTQVEALFWLSSLEADARIVPVPSQTVAFHFAYRSDITFLTCMDFIKWRARWDELYYRYPLPNPDLAMWKRDHSATHALIDMTRVRDDSEYLNKLGLSQFPIVAQNERYLLLSLVRDNHIHQT